MNRGGVNGVLLFFGHIRHDDNPPNCPIYGGLILQLSYLEFNRTCVRSGLSQSRKEEGKKVTFLGYAFVNRQTHNRRKVRMECNTGQVLDVGSLYQRIAGLKDKRKARGKRYALATILLGLFLAKLCREDKPSGIADWVALRGEWLVRELGLKRKSMPSHHTYRMGLGGDYR
jgi:hypothetical protein